MAHNCLLRQAQGSGKVGENTNVGLWNATIDGSLPGNDFSAREPEFTEPIQHALWL